MAIGIKGGIYIGNNEVVLSPLCQLQIKSDITQVIMKNILWPLLAITNILGIYTGSSEVQIITIAGNCI